MKRHVVIPAALAAILALLSGSQFSPAATAFVAPAPAWTIRSLAQPTNFSSLSNHACEIGSGSETCDSYTLIVANVGNEAADREENAPVDIADTLPAGISAVHIEGADLAAEGALRQLHCTLVPLQCTDPTRIPVDDTLLVTINVVVDAGVAGNVTNSASVSGGGAPAVGASEQTTVRTGQAGFGIQDFNLQALDAGGSSDEQAGGHPNSLTTSFDLNSTNLELINPREPTKREVYYHPAEEPRDVAIDLPLGFFGNPESIPQCPLNVLLKTNEETACPLDSRVGTIALEGSDGVFKASIENGSGTTAVYNVTPEAGYQAEFAFTYLGVPVFIYARVIHTGNTYAVQATVPGIPEIKLVDSSLTLFGEPAQNNGGSSLASPFFTNPVNCQSGTTPARIAMDTWQHPGHWYEAVSEPPAYPSLVGCEMLQFQPSLRVQPDTTRADEPAGYGFEIEIPQNESPVSPGTPELKDASVTLPPGTTVSPAAADGLAACPASGENGIDLPSGNGRPGEAGEGETIGPDGMPHLTPGHCPSESTVGSVEITTPLLAEPLEGHVYLARPGCGGAGQAACTEEDAADGNLIHVYLEATGSGVVVKLEGHVSVNRSTGRLTATFKENPQLPFSKLKLHFDGGPRASLANPATCGVATTTSDLSPWSAPITPDATPASSFSVDWDGQGGRASACPATLPFAPTLSAGTVTPTAGAFSPFTLTLKRLDREQNLSRLSVTTPPGLLGMLSSVTLCTEAQANQNACPTASEIGTTTVAAGPGSHPFWVTGHVFLTESYNGAPFGLSVVVPAVAGPFNLGNVRVRAAINVDPKTSALTITSDPLPQVVDGIPLRVQTINVAVTRPGFMFNPTNCEAHQITATVAGSRGGSAQASSPFAAANCKSLPFSPKFTVATSTRSSKKNGASLDVKVAYKPGQANIRSVAVALPKQLPSRLTTIQQACPEKTFAANPATCPAGSLIGIAKARTPVLPVLLSGPAYLVSHGGAAFPDVVLILQGEGVRVDLTGSVNIHKGITSSAFANVPDVPITSFDLSLPRGPHSALTATLPASALGNLCGQKLTMPTTLTAQNGLQEKQSTKVGVTGCPKRKAKTSTKTKKKGKK